MNRWYNNISSPIFAAVISDISAIAEAMMTDSKSHLVSSAATAQLDIAEKLKKLYTMWSNPQRAWIADKKKSRGAQQGDP